MSQALRIGVAHGKYAPTKARQTSALLAHGVELNRIITNQRGCENLPRLMIKVARRGSEIVLLPDHGFSKYYLNKMRKNGALVTVVELSQEPS